MPFPWRVHHRRQRSRVVVDPAIHHETSRASPVGPRSESIHPPRLDVDRGDLSAVVRSQDAELDRAAPGAGFEDRGRVLRGRHAEDGFVVGFGVLLDAVCYDCIRDEIAKRRDRDRDVKVAKGDLLERNFDALVISCSKMRATDEKRHELSSGTT